MFIGLGVGKHFALLGERGVGVSLSKYSMLISGRRGIQPVLAFLTSRARVNRGMEIRRFFRDGKLHHGRGWRGKVGFGPLIAERRVIFAKNFIVGLGYLVDIGGFSRRPFFAVNFK